ncbi:hypothetical protein DFH06DRAFT_1350563 [Mycena polygramma]|nr:hypothetical protein DFH06DRAFT_1352967 [Mycena polygramma]KAJ7603091.1 hypothetical protein DFH06DRAFT_1350563 [Mycena polygramma]
MPTDPHVEGLLAVFDDLNLDGRTRTSDAQQPPQQPAKPLKRPTATSARPTLPSPTSARPTLPSPTSTRPTLPSPTSATPSSPASATSARRLLDDANLYHFSSANGSGFTNLWDVAAHQTQGVAGGSPRRLSPKKRSGPPSKGIVVFVGIEPGPYRSWAEAEPFVKGVPGNIYQGYSSFEKATAAFLYAQERCWTRVALPRGFIPPPGYTPTSTSIPRLPTPISYHSATDEPNPLHTADTGRDGVWYIVFCGINPGIYQSSLEMALNTVGIRAAVFASCPSKELAVQRFQDALEENRVEIVTPLYHP